MSHVDEGTLHALLDGELAPAEVVEVQTHFATCPACSARLDSARKLLAETERLVSALEPSKPVAEAVAARAPRPAAATPPAAAPIFRFPSGDSHVLIPDNPTAAEVRRRRLKVLGWAATILVVVGAGVFGIQMQMGLYDRKPAGTLRIRPEEFSTPGTLADSIAAARATANQQAGAATNQAAAPSAQGAAAPAGSLATARQPSAPTPTAAPAPPPRAQPTPPPAKQTPPPAKQQRAPAPANAQPQAPASGDTGDDSANEDRQTLALRAAKATEQLDRDRNRERAAAATAALDSARRAAAQQAAAQQAAAQQAAAAPAAPVVPTLDQRAQVANRIGLDEAARQLGGPLHAIDGMSRQLVGVISPQLVPGSDTTRAVIRAVYIDRAGRLIFLDQQHMKAGQTDLPSTPQARRNGELRWMAGQVLIVLQADLPTDSLRFIARHVR